jgi:hypothetical protein
MMEFSNVIGWIGKEKRRHSSLSWIGKTYKHST